MQFLSLKFYCYINPPPKKTFLWGIVESGLCVHLSVCSFVCQGRYLANRFKIFLSNLKHPFKFNIAYLELFKAKLGPIRITCEFSPSSSRNFSFFKNNLPKILFQDTSTTGAIWLMLRFTAVSWLAKIHFPLFPLQGMGISMFSNICYLDTFSRRFYWSFRFMLWLKKVDLQPFFIGFYTFSTISPVMSGNFSYFKNNLLR